MGVWHGVAKRVVEGGRLPALQATSETADSGVARLQGIEALGMTGLDETLGSP
jgi:hypothetical protein